MCGHHLQWIILCLFAVDMGPSRNLVSSSLIESFSLVMEDTVEPFSLDPRRWRIRSVITEVLDEFHCCWYLGSLWYDTLKYDKKLTIVPATHMSWWISYFFVLPALLYLPQQLWKGSLDHCRACLVCCKWEEKVQVGNGEEKMRKRWVIEICVSKSFGVWLQCGSVSEKSSVLKIGFIIRAVQYWIMINRRLIRD